MVLRKRYIFDGERLPLSTRLGYDTFAVSADGRTFYIRGGRNAGVRLKIHFSTDNRIYFGHGLHARALVEATEEQTWHIKDELKLAAAGCRETPLLTMRDVPGFSQGNSHDTGGWYSTGEHAVEIPKPFWATDGTRVYDIREGIYVCFPDGTHRLIDRKQYYRLPLPFFIEKKPDLRQGDLLVWHTDGSFPTTRSAPYRSLYIGRHVILPVGEDQTLNGVPAMNGYFDGFFVKGARNIAHDEHETVSLEPAQTYFVALVPGTSRPFSRGATDRD